MQNFHLQSIARAWASWKTRTLSGPWHTAMYDTHTGPLSWGTLQAAYWAVFTRIKAFEPGQQAEHSPAFPESQGLGSDRTAARTCTGLQSELSRPPPIGLQFRPNLPTAGTNLGVRLALFLSTPGT